MALDSDVLVWYSGLTDLLGVFMDSVDRDYWIVMLPEGRFDGLFGAARLEDAVQYFDEEAAKHRAELLNGTIIPIKAKKPFNMHV